MNWKITDDEKKYLRELAKKQAEYAALPVMADRRKMWYDLNDGKKPSRPPVIIETWTFEVDFLPDSLLRCSTEEGRGIEKQLLKETRRHELIDDDKVVSDTFDIGWFTKIDWMGVTIARQAAQAVDGGLQQGYQFIHPITDLKRDLHLLKPAECSVNRERTAAWKEYVEDIFGDVLPVALRTGAFGRNGLTHQVVELMGMEAFFMAMYDSPEEVHKLMKYLSDNSLRVMRWAEKEGLLRVNNGNQISFGSSFNFTRQLPKPGLNGESARLCDMWSAADSQETVGVSPEMFHEFCFPYYRDCCEPLGFIYWGCCEPAHPLWDDISRIPHLKKVSISRWCDEKFMGEALKGNSIVYSRKPNPNLLGVNPVLDEEAWGKHIRETLLVTRGVPVEFIIRDVYTMHGNLGKARRAVELARQEIDKHWKS